MAIETERKFLVTNTDYKTLAYDSRHICQGYICRESGRTVRVRITDTNAYLTIKGPSNTSAMSRYEWECELNLKDALELMALCGSGVIEKVRYLVRCGAHVFEVDEFLGENTGLVVAEVELQSEDEAFEKPSFLGMEVTGQRCYYNSNLLINPYSVWGKER